MPFQVKKQPNGKYKLWNIKKKVYAKPSYNSKEAAINAGKNFMRYRNEKPVVKKNKIVTKKYIDGNKLKTSNLK